MKALITFTLMAIVLTAFLLIAYQPEEKAVPASEPKPVSRLTDPSETKPVILIPNDEMRRSATIVALFSDDGGPVNEAIRERQALRSARDNHTSIARSQYASR